MSRKTLAIFGMAPHAWKSVDRTRAFYQAALQERYDCVHVDTEQQLRQLQPHAVLNFTGNAGWTLQEHPSAPLIFAIHGGAILNQDFLRQHLQRLHTSDTLLVNCSSDIAIFNKMFDGNGPGLAYLPLPVDQAIFHPLDKAMCRQGSVFERFDCIIGFVNRLLPQKNLHRFLHMLARLKAVLHPKKVGGIVVGDYWIDYPVLPYTTAAYPEKIGALVQALQLQDDLLYFPAALPEEQLLLSYNAMDVLFHPTNSIDENFGYVPVEAMACGVPVVGAAYGGLKDSVLHGVTGYTTPTWATHSGIRMDLLNAERYMISILAGDKKRQDMSGAAAAHVADRFSYARCAAALQGAIDTAISRREQEGARPVAVIKTVGATPARSLLPAVTNGWEKYRDVVADYASSDVPVPGPHSVLQVAAPLVWQGNTCTLGDPAWPAAFTLTDEAAALLRVFETPVPFASVAAHAAKIRQWLEDGLLVCSNADRHGMPPFSVIIPWKDRKELLETLRANQPHFIAAAAEVIVVNCGGDAQWLADACLQFPLLRPTVAHIAGGTFNKCRALNAGASLARHDILFLLDADICLHAGCFHELWDALAGGSIVTIDRVVESNAPQQPVEGDVQRIAYSTTLTLKDGRSFAIETNSIDLCDGSRAAPGLVALHKEKFLAVGGMNAALDTWGWEDLDLLARLQLKLNATLARAGAVTHLSHGDDVRNLQGLHRAQSEQKNFLACLANYQLGLLDGTYRADVENFTGQASAR